MKKYMWTMQGMEANESSGNYCRADDVATRIQQLEWALKSCAVAMSMHLKATETFDKYGREALLEADRALALMES